MKILVFNPEHDLCLAANKPNYTPPASARQFGEECYQLMQYLGDEDDLCVPASRVGEAIKAHPEAEAIVPWGWNATLKHQLIRQGVPESLLPTPYKMTRYRNLSCRSMGCKLNGSMEDLHGLPCTSKSEMLKSPNEVQQFLFDSPDHMAVLKSPFSGSGRGVRLVREPLTPKELDWVNKTIRESGFVEAELYSAIVQNFAMLFRVEKGKTKFAGYSLFETKGFTYTHNLLLTDKEIEQRLRSLVPMLDLSELSDWYEYYFEEFRHPIRDHFAFGIDMFLGVEVGELCLNPCCDFNYRYTMGYVAHELLRKHPEHHGKRFCINTPTPDNPQYSYSII